MRNPAWTKEELILALDLYFRIGFPNVTESHPEIIRLSAILQRLPFHANRGSNFRNPTGVYMKLCNFLRLDPNYAGVGLDAGSKQDKIVWDEFAFDKPRLSIIANSIVDSHKLLIYQGLQVNQGTVLFMGTGRPGRMVGHRARNSENAHANRRAFLSAVSQRDAFLDWLFEGKNKEYSPYVLVDCLDEISEYALNKKMCSVDFWSVSQQSEFQAVYIRILSDRMLRVTHRDTIKIFPTAGKLYLKFLYDKSYKKTTATRGLHDTTSLPDSNKVRETKFAKIIGEVLSAHFPNGFMIDSPIELMRFRRFAVENFGSDISLADEKLKKTISTCGTLFDGKVYLISSEVESRIKNEVDLAVSGGADIVFYSSFYGRNEEWLFAGSVISEEMLKDLLYKLYPQYTHKINYFSPKVENGTELSKIKSELIRVWGSDVVLNYEQLSERLPYIPLDKIKYVLGQNSNFIRNATEEYTHSSKVNLTDEECVAIVDYVATACRTNGYASLNNIPLGEIEVNNHGLTLTAIHNAVFGIVLADIYDKRGKIITRKGDTLDSLTLMKEHCRTLDKCSLQDLLDFERELTGESHRWIALEAGYSVMVRADADTFFAEKYVHFNANEIDATLGLFVTGDYLPLKSVTTFAAFPHCGQAWNLFLLESYCRRFSNRFRFAALAYNYKNVGAIVRKRLRLSYGRIMADAVAKSNIPLEKEAIKEFLCNNGYIGRRSYAKTDELIKHAQVIRERRD